MTVEGTIPKSTAPLFKRSKRVMRLGTNAKAARDGLKDADGITKFQKGMAKAGKGLKKLGERLMEDEETDDSSKTQPRSCS